MALGPGTNFWQSLSKTPDYYNLDLIVERDHSMLTLSPEKPWNLFDPKLERTEYSMWTSQREIFQHQKFEAGCNSNQRHWSSSSCDSSSSDYFSGDFSGVSSSPTRQFSHYEQEGAESFVNGSDHIVTVLSDCYSALCDLQWDRNFVEKLVGLAPREIRNEAKEFFSEIQRNDILEVISLSKAELRSFNHLLNNPDRCSAYFNLLQTLKYNFIKDENHSRDYYSHLSYTWDQDNQLLKSWETTQEMICQYVSSSVGSSQTKLDRLNPILENLAKIIQQVRLNLYTTLSKYNFEDIPKIICAPNGKSSMIFDKQPHRATDPYLMPANRFPPSRKPKYVPSYRYQSINNQKESRKSF